MQEWWLVVDHLNTAKLDDWDTALINEPADVNRSSIAPSAYLGSSQHAVGGMCGRYVRCVEGFYALLFTSQSDMSVLSSQRYLSAIPVIQKLWNMGCHVCGASRATYLYIHVGCRDATLNPRRGEVRLAALCTAGL